MDWDKYILSNENSKICTIKDYAEKYSFFARKIYLYRTEVVKKVN